MTPSIFTNLKRIITRICSTFKIAINEVPAVGRHRSINNLDSLTFSLYQHQSTRATKKSVYDDFKETLSCCYKTFIESVNRVAWYTIRLLFIIMRLGKKHAHLLKFTDSTDIPVCLKKKADDHKTIKELSGFGRSSKGWYY